MFIYSYVTPDGRGIRKTLDWLVPYAVGEKTWAWEQITDFDQRNFFELFRRAAIYYGDPVMKLFFVLSTRKMWRDMRCSSSIRKQKGPARTNNPPLHPAEALGPRAADAHVRPGNDFEKGVRKD